MSLLAHDESTHGLPDLHRNRNHRLGNGRGGPLWAIIQPVKTVLHVLLASVAILLPACRSMPAATRAIVSFNEAVQSEDFDRLFCLLDRTSAAGELSREDFEAWVRGQYDGYRESRDRGWVELEGQAIQLVKLFGLGRGTFFSYGSVRSVGPERRVVRTDLRFGYGQVDLSHASVGTTFYLSGVPVGRSHPVRIPAGPREVSLEVLEGIALDWTLVRRGDSELCPGGWAVASVVPVEGTESTTTITWVF